MQALRCLDLLDDVSSSLLARHKGTVAGLVSREGRGWTEKLEAAAGRRPGRGGACGHRRDGERAAAAVIRSVRRRRKREI